MRKTREEKAITLIALIITIVVLLILAVVAINAVTGDGIIQHASNATSKYKESEELEKLKLSMLNWKLIPEEEKVTLLGYIKQKYMNNTESNKNDIILKNVEAGEDGSVILTTSSGNMYKATIDGNIEPITNLQIQNLSQLEEKYQFSYYSSISKAIVAVNENTIGTNVDANKENAVAAIYTTEEGEIIVRLLKDSIENSTITPTKSMTINLGGNILTFNSTVGMSGVANNRDIITIDGTLSGSEINITNQNATTLFVPLTNTFNIKGGIYSAESINSTAMVLDLEGGNVNAFNCTMNSKANNETPVTLEIKSNSSVNLNNCEITVDSENVTTCAIRNYSDSNLTMNDCYIFSDANSPIESNITAIGVMNIGNATLNNCYVSAIKSGLDTRLGSKTYVNGGTYESTDHGGIYFCHGPNGEAYINGAKIICCGYKGKYENTEGANFGGFYIGGVGEAGSNMKAYINNCSITGGSSAFVIRGSSGEQNNEVYISNSTIGTNKVRIDNDTLKLYIGKGCNFTAENTNRPNSVVITNEVYTKK